MTQFSVIKNGLLPHDDAARAMLAKMKIGSVVDVELQQPMNTKFNGKIFAAISKLAKLSDVPTETMKARLMVQTGRFDMVALNDKRKVLVAHSMSRNAMSQTQRELFWNDMRRVAREEILPSLHLDPRDQEEIDALFADEFAASGD
jgi:hypothetical protein